MTPCKKNVLTWCISMYHMIGLKLTCGITKVTLKVAKKLWVSRSTGKSSKSLQLHVHVPRAKGARFLPSRGFVLHGRKNENVLYLCQKNNFSFKVVL